MIIKVDGRTWLISPLLVHHPWRRPDPWRTVLQENGSVVDQEGTPFTTLYVLARKTK